MSVGEKRDGGRSSAGESAYAVDDDIRATAKFAVEFRREFSQLRGHAVGMSKRLMRRLFRCWLLCRFAFARIGCLERFKDVVGDVDRRAEIKRVSDHEIVSLRARVILDFLKQ